VNQFFISPGSRSTSLTVAVASNERTRSLVHFDERGAAYAALGFSKATRKPAALICTSGTAAANFSPAIVEASQEQIPLIVLTADRPPELRYTGANQTINQVQLYGDYVRWFCDLPCPSDEIDASFILTTVDQAVYRALRSPSGPVHINCMFREPLAPTGEFEDYLGYLSPVSSWMVSDQPYTQYSISRSEPDETDLHRVAEWMNDTECGIVVAGALRNNDDRRAAISLTQQLGWPLLPDISSGLRIAGSAGSFRRADNSAAYYYDLLLHSGRLAEENRPSAVIHLGGRVTSKRLALWLKDSRPQHYLTVTDHPYRQDPDHLVTDRFDCDVAAFSQAIGPFLKSSGAATEWTTSFVKASASVGTMITNLLRKGDDLSEPSVARLISQHINPKACLFLGNSMPIRDMDSFTDPSGPAVPVGCNRGASGIDGVVATAFGFALGSDKKVTLLLGDLALLHDINSLCLLRQLEQPMTVIVINNNGGGIFSFLPIAKRNDIFEQFWGTPHNMNFKYAARQFGLGYECPSTLREFQEVYRSSQTEDSSTLIEVKTDREDNARFHEELLRTAIAELDKG